MQNHIYSDEPNSRQTLKFTSYTVLQITPKIFPYACVPSCFSHVQLFVTQWTVACQAPLFMGFSRQEYWSELPCPPPGDLPDTGIEPWILHCRWILYRWAPRRPTNINFNNLFFLIYKAFLDRGLRFTWLVICHPIKTSSVCNHTLFLVYKLALLLWKDLATCIKIKLFQKSYSWESVLLIYCPWIRWNYRNLSYSIVCNSKRSISLKSPLTKGKLNKHIIITHENILQLKKEWRIHFASMKLPKTR